MALLRVASSRSQRHSFANMSSLISLLISIECCWLQRTENPTKNDLNKRIFIISYTKNSGSRLVQAGLIKQLRYYQRPSQVLSTFLLCHSPDVAYCSQACPLMSQIGAPVPSSSGRHNDGISRGTAIFSCVFPFISKENLVLELSRSFPSYLTGQNFIICPRVTDPRKRKWVYRE